jgi:3-hydroxyacyl-CoA dehydrogenase
MESNNDKLQNLEAGASQPRTGTDSPANPKVVILGANGVMGGAAAAVFAAAGYQVTMLARDLDKARQGQTAAQNAARAEAVAERITLGTYGDDLARSVAGASLIFEALAEEIGLKRQFFAQVDAARQPDAIVATNSSGLSIAEMANGRSDSFRRHFMGIHLYNPPHIIVGTELVPHAESDSALVERMRNTLAQRLGRKVIVTRDRPAFVGNRAGFRVMNEAAQLAEEHGVALIDYLAGPHTGRAMAPLQTVDLVGWDVHKAIVDNVHANCVNDPARERFKLPSFMEHGVAAGRLGDKTPESGGFYRRAGGRTVEVLAIGSNRYEPYLPPRPVEFVERMKALNRVGRYRQAAGVLAEATGPEAAIAQRVILGYISYALGLVGEAAECHADVDTIMSYGFNWTPPGVLADLIGVKRVAAMLERFNLPIPAVVEKACRDGVRLFSGGVLEYGRTFIG